MIGSVALDAMMCRAVQIVPFVTWKGYQTQHMQAPEDRMEGDVQKFRG